MNAVAKVIEFPKPQQPKIKEVKGMYSDKFDNGYVMSSRLYRREVWPFISDAARNVYAELENRINGHNKESDFVSYSQLQGSDLDGARSMSRPTVSRALKELIKLDVISVIASGKQGMKSYRINEISIKDRFTNETSVVTTPVQQVHQFSVVSKPLTSVVTTHTIDSSLDSLDIKKKNSVVDNSDSKIFSNSVEYHCDNKNLYTLRELSNICTIKKDFMHEAKKINPSLSDETLISDLKNFAQWSTTREKTTAQGWMNYWIYRIQKQKSPKAKTPKAVSTKPKANGLTSSQVDYFASLLGNDVDFATVYAAAAGESQKSFESRISSNLRKPEYQKKWAVWLRGLGFTGQLGDDA